MSLLQSSLLDDVQIADQNWFQDLQKDTPDMSMAIQEKQG